MAGAIRTLGDRHRANGGALCGRVRSRGILHGGQAHDHGGQHHDTSEHNDSPSCRSGRRKRRDLQDHAGWTRKDRSSLERYKFHAVREFRLVGLRNPYGYYDMPANRRGADQQARNTRVMGDQGKGRNAELTKLLAASLATRSHVGLTPRRSPQRWNATEGVPYRRLAPSA